MYMPLSCVQYTPFDPLQEGQQDGRTGTQTQGLQLHEQRSRHQEAHFNDRHNHKRQRQPEQPVALEQQQQQQPESYAEEFKPSKKHKHNKPVSQLQRLAEKVAADKADKEQERQQVSSNVSTDLCTVHITMVLASNMSSSLMLPRN